MYYWGPEDPPESSLEQFEGLVNEELENAGVEEREEQEERDDEDQRE